MGEAFEIVFFFFFFFGKAGLVCEDSGGRGWRGGFLGFFFLCSESW